MRYSAVKPFCSARRNRRSQGRQRGNWIERAAAGWDGNALESRIPLHHQARYFSALQLDTVICWE